MSGKTVDGVDLERIGPWLNEHGVDGRIEHAVPLVNGTQNILVRITIGGRDVVLRRPPLNPRPRNDELMMREAKVLGALANTTVPHPTLIAACDDPAVLGDAVFFVMDAVNGFNPGEVAYEVLTERSDRDLVADGLIDVLADLGSIDYRTVGLADFGRPDGFLERQTDRWGRELASYRSLTGYLAEPLPGFDGVRDYLTAGVPKDFRPGIMHGDYHPGNVICAENYSIAAVVDWEMCTIGDPLLDLGRFLALWPDGDDVITDQFSLWAAGPVTTPRHLAERYAEQAERSIDDLDWYVVMGCYKLGIVLEGTYARSCAGLAPRPIGDRLHDVAHRLFHRASRLADVF